jgi:anti-anti-sigma factor
VDTFAVTSHEFDGGRVFTLRGELDALSCRGVTDRVVGPPGSLLVVDLSHLTFMDSSGLGAIHAARQMAIKDGGNLVVCRPTPIVHRVLQITGLDMWVTDWNPEWSSGSRLECAHEERHPAKSFSKAVAVSRLWPASTDEVLKSQ